MKSLGLMKHYSLFHLADLQMFLLKPEMKFTIGYLSSNVWNDENSISQVCSNPQHPTIRPEHTIDIVRMTVDTKQ